MTPSTVNIRASPSLSVVVIGRNEGERLVRCLESVKKMQGADRVEEIIYADSQSSDNSVERARELGARVIEVDVERPCAATGRNAGWREASGAIILFLDGDTVLEADFAIASLGEFDDERVAAVAGRVRELHPQASLFNRVLDLDWNPPVGEVESCGGNALIRRAALEEVDGFDDTLIAGEEPELCRRLRGKGWRLLMVDRPMVGHELGMTQWRQYWRRSVRTGHAYAEISRRFADTDSPLWRAQSRGNIVRGAFLIALILMGVVSAPLTLSPACGAIVLFALLVVRTAFKNRRKSGDGALLLLYGVHAHVQQIPILVGQIRYHLARRRGRRLGLVEYKEER